MNYWQNEQVFLRSVELDDAPIFWAWNQDSEMARHLDFIWPPTSLASVQAWVEKQAQQQMKEDCFHWIIENPMSEAVGAINTHHCEARNGTFSYGINIDRAHWGCGYASAAIQLVLRYYFQELRYQKVTVSVHGDNPRSMALHEKLGFMHEGTLRRMFYTGGGYVDVHWYGMTREEWDDYQTVSTADS